MKYLKFISISIVILSIVFSGCLDDTPEETPVPTPVPTPIETEEPTVVPTTLTPTPTPERIPSVYKSDVDNYYGFRRVIDQSNKPAPYDVFNRTLSIYAGDKVIWINDADDPEEKLTIISADNLWDNTTAILRWRYKQFNYTFNQPGTYEIYIREYPYEQHQIIIVNR